MATQYLNAGSRGLGRGGEAYPHPDPSGRSRLGRGSEYGPETSPVARVDKAKVLAKFNNVNEACYTAHRAAYSHSGILAS